MKISRKIIAMILCALILLSFSACSKGEETNTSSAISNEFPITVGGVTLKAAPERVAVLSDSIADIILALGYESVLKAKSAACTQDELAILPDVSFDNVDELIKLDLDLVLTDSTPENMGELALKGIPVMVFDEATTRTQFEELYTDVAAAFKGSVTGAAFGKERAQDIFTSIDDILRALPESTVVITACYVYDIEGKASAGDSYPSLLLKSSRLLNAFEYNDSADISIGTIKIANPQYIFCPVGLKDAIMADENFASLRAVKNSHVYEIDETLIKRQGLSILDAVTYITDTVFSEENNTDDNNDDTSFSTTDEPTVSAPPTGFVEMKYGDNSELIKQVQARLKELGYLNTEPTGEFGDMTEHAVTNFQFINEYNPTGIINEATYNAIFSDSAIPMPEY